MDRGHSSEDKSQQTSQNSNGMILPPPPGFEQEENLPKKSNCGCCCGNHQQNLIPPPPGFECSNFPQSSTCHKCQCVSSQSQQGCNNKTLEFQDGRSVHSKDDKLLPPPPGFSDQKNRGSPNCKSGVKTIELKLNIPCKAEHQAKNSRRNEYCCLIPPQCTYPIRHCHPSCPNSAKTVSESDPDIPLNKRNLPPPLRCCGCPAPPNCFSIPSQFGHSPAPENPSITTQFGHSHPPPDYPPIPSQFGNSPASPNYPPSPTQSRRSPPSPNYPSIPAQSEHSPTPSNYPSIPTGLSTPHDIVEHYETEETLNHNSGQKLNKTQGIAEHIETETPLKPLKHLKAQESGGFVPPRLKSKGKNGSIRTPNWSNRPPKGSSEPSDQNFEPVKTNFKLSDNHHYWKTDYENPYEVLPDYTSNYFKNSLDHCMPYYMAQNTDDAYKKIQIGEKDGAIMEDPRIIFDCTPNMLRKKKAKKKCCCAFEINDQS